jgi:hypothetical protein
VNVALLVTGKTEWHGLGPALERLFPDHPIRMYPSKQEVQSHGERFPTNGFTTTTLTAAQWTTPPESATDLVSRAVGAAIDGNDLVVILDDLEEANREAPAFALDVFRAAVSAHLADIRSASLRGRTAARLREHVSLHLAVPMIESWFFTFPDSLRAWCNLPVIPALAQSDPEEFLTADAMYDAATESHCSCWMTDGRDKKKRPKWLGDLDRRRHPKGYLQWLCRDAQAPTCTRYSESETGLGVTLLKRLEWWEALGGSVPRMRYLASMVDDIADALGQPPCTGPLSPAQLHPLTSRRTPRPSPVLRNL